MMRRAIFSICVVLASFACVGTTGGELLDFSAAAAGAEDATSPLAFDETTIAGHAWHVTLTQATLHIGAVYLDQSLPVSGAGDTTCILPSIYTAEVLGTASDGGANGLDVDLLSSAPQSFPSLGHGTTTQSLAAQVWLTGGDVNALEDETKILTIVGSASDDTGATFPFAGSITIGTNRIPTNQTTGANPPCKQRIVSPIPTTTSVESTGGLLVRIDARRLFDDVDFSALPNANGTYTFSDDPSSASYTEPSINLWTNLHASGTYAFIWSQSL